jgi:hypothetical protein
LANERVFDLFNSHANVGGATCSLDNWQQLRVGWDLGFNAEPLNFFLPAIRLDLGEVLGILRVDELALQCVARARALTRLPEPGPEFSYRTE